MGELLNRVSRKLCARGLERLGYACWNLTRIPIHKKPKVRIFNTKAETIVTIPEETEPEKPEVVEVEATPDTV
jgi:hypothetical protein